jgi:TolB-like protein
MRIPAWLLALAFLVPASIARAGDEQKIAVIDFVNTAGLQRQEVDYITHMVRASAARVLTRGYLVMTRENILELLPPGTDYAQCANGTCEVDFARKVGADFVVSGEVLRFGSSLKVTLNLHHALTAALVKSETASAKSVDTLEGPVGEAADRLFSPLAGAFAGRGGAGDGRFGGGTVTQGQAFDTGKAIENKFTDDTGYLTIESDPAGAVFSLNGQETGKTPKTVEQMAGRWVVTAELGKLYHPARQEVTVTPGSNQKVSLKLEPAFGALKVNSEPSGAEVWVEGEKVGSTPYANPQKPSGSYEVRVVRESYLTWKQDLTVKDGQETARMARLEQNFGGLAVTSEPPGAAIELNGRATREVTPHTFEVLEPGVYTVKLTREGYGDALERASVQNRQTARLNLALQARLGLLSLMSTNPDGTPCEGRVYLDGEQKGVTPLKLQVTATTHEVKVVCNGAERQENVDMGHDEKKKLEWVVGAARVAPAATGTRTGGGSGALRDNGDGTVTDPATGLVWEKKPSTGNLNWEMAKAHCQAKGRGWHLPSISELRSLIRGCPGTVSGGACKVTDACLSGSCWSSDDCWARKSGGGPAGGCFWDATLEGSCGWFWSSSLHAVDSLYAWYVYFDLGYVSYAAIDNGKGVRCVRPGP